MRLLLRLVLLSVLVLWLTLSSGCFGTLGRTPTGLRAKPTMCLLEVQDHLPFLTPEFVALSMERIQLEIDLQRQPPPDFSEITAKSRRIVTIDDRQAQILLTLHNTSGVLYQSAVSQLQDCQEWVKDQP